MPLFRTFGGNHETLTNWKCGINVGCRQSAHTHTMRQQQPRGGDFSRKKIRQTGKKTPKFYAIFTHIPQSRAESQTLKHGAISGEQASDNATQPFNISCCWKNLFRSPILRFLPFRGVFRNVCDLCVRKIEQCSGLCINRKPIERYTRAKKVPQLPSQHRNRFKWSLY